MNLAHKSQSTPGAHEGLRLGYAISYVWPIIVSLLIILTLSGLLMKTPQTPPPRSADNDGHNFIFSRLYIVYRNNPHVDK